MNLFAIVALVSSLVSAQPSRMNGHAFRDFHGFQSSYKLVTVRYRTDNDEMRWVYANLKAYLTLMAETTDYPDGAVFGKIAVVSRNDPNFMSSRIPAGTVRYQFMVRNRKNKSTGGWDYAIFSAGGVADADVGGATSISCYQCHTRVRELGYVFSQPAAFLVRKPLRLISVSDNFSTVPVSDLPEGLRKLIPAGFVSADSLDGPLRSRVFSGTLNEIVPTLAQRVASSGHPAVLVSADDKQFSAVYPTPEKCDDGKGVIAWEVMSPPAYKNTFCLDNPHPQRRTQ